jgi:hypothetical protein
MKRNGGGENGAAFLATKPLQADEVTQPQPQHPSSKRNVAPSSRRRAAVRA